MGGMAQSKSEENSKTEPWAAQEPYLLNAFGNAQGAYDNAMAQGPYKGDYVAHTNQPQYDAANTQYNTAMGQSTQANNGILGSGYSNLASGFGAANGAMGGLGALAANNTGQNLVGTGQGITDALNQGVPAQVQAAMYGANRNAAENTIPNLYRSAAAGNNLNSDRTALAQGVVERGLGETAANMTGQLQAQNTQTGLSTAQALTGQNAGILGQVGSLGANIGQSGLNALSTSINNAGTIGNQSQQGADKVQQLDQSNLNNTLQQYQQNQQYPWQQLQNYMSIVGGQNWGSQTQGTKTSTPSTLSTIGGILGGIGALI